MLKYILGALFGGSLGYFVLHRLIGCSTGSCPITANPYTSTLYGVALGILLASTISLPATQASKNAAQASGAAYRTITASDAKTRIDSGEALIILDVRTESEYRAGHIPDAILIPNETITDEMPDLLPALDAEILIYCRSGNRSAQAARKLIAIGYTNVYDFGGIIDWPYDLVTS